MSVVPFLLSSSKTLSITGATLAGRFCVHEFLPPQTPVASYSMSAPDRQNEGDGRDIQCDDDGKWKGFCIASGTTISAAPFVHRIPSVGICIPWRQSTRVLSRGGPSIDHNHAELVVKGVRPSLLFTRQPIKPPDGFSLEPPSLLALGRKLVLLGDTCRLRSPWRYPDPGPNLEDSSNGDPSVIDSLE